MPQATSSAVIGLPSSHVASSRMVNVHSVKSSLGWPRSVARSGTRTISPVSLSREYCVSDRWVSACWIELPVTDQPLVGSRSSGPGSSGRYTVMVPPADAPSTSGAGPWRSASLAMVSEASLKPWSLLPLPVSSSFPLPPQAARVTSAALVASTAAALVRLIVQPFVVVRTPEAPGVTLGESASAAGLRVERVTNRVAEEVECEHEGDDAEQGLPQVEGVVAPVGHRVGDGLAPRGTAGHTDAEERETGLRRDERRQHQRDADDDRGREVGQQLTEQDASGGHAQHPGGVDELTLAQGEHLAADQAGHRHPAEQRQDGDQRGDLHGLVAVAGAEAVDDDRGDRQRREQEGDGQEEVGDERQDPVDDTARESRDQADHDADHGGEERGRSGDEERGAAPVDPVRQVVRTGARREAEGVGGVERVERGARLGVAHARLGEVALQDLARGDRVEADPERLRDEVGEDRHQEEEDHDDRARDGDLVAAQPAEGDLHRRLAGDLLGLLAVRVVDLRFVAERAQGLRPRRLCRHSLPIEFGSGGVRRAPRGPRRTGLYVTYDA